MRSGIKEPSPLGEGRVGVNLRILSAYGERRVVGPTLSRRAFGVPPGGPFDRLSAVLANALVGLPDEAPVLEIALGPVLLEAREPVIVAIVGGPDGAFPLKPGERLEVRPENARAYVATSPLPSEGRAVLLRHLADPPRLGPEPFRILPGPQAHLLDGDSFTTQTYTVALASNRVGVRLDGTPMPHGLSLLSEPAIPGSVQLPPDGRPIVLGPDGPTIGGYPKIAVVIDADLDRLGRAKPGDTIGFQIVTIEEARAMGRIARMEAKRRGAELRV